MRRRTGAADNRWIVYGVGSALLLAALGVGVLVVQGRSDETDDVSAVRGATEGAAMLAARTEAIAFFTLDPTNAEKQIDGVLAHATGEFLGEYSNRRSEAVQSVQSTRRTVSAVVPPGGTAIAGYSSTKATVLVAVEETSRAVGHKPVVSDLRMVLTMDRVGSVWKTATLDQLAGSTMPGEADAGPLPGGNETVVAAAAHGVRQLLGYDYRTLPKNLEAAIPLLTASFGSEFAHTFTTTVRPLALAKKSVTAAYVRSAGLVVRDGDTARCLVFVDQVFSPGKHPSVTDERLFVDLRRVDGNWLVDGLGRA